MNKLSDTERFDKQDFTHIVILTIIALVIGVYLIATTVMIAKDGVSYINYAKALSSNPLDTIRDCSEYAPLSYTPGYPFLILIAHKAANLFGNFSSVSSWTYSAQTVTLLCRLFTIIPLYLIGKKLVGSKHSFWAILILIMLPDLAELGSDALRDWPHILFLATGILFLVTAAKHEKWPMFGLAGLVAGLGYIIRPMCAQLLVYGFLWLIYNLLNPKHKCNISRTKLVAGLLLLFIGFAIVATPYMKIRGEILPKRLQQIIESFPSRHSYNEISEQNDATYQAKFMPTIIIKAFWELVKKISANLMYFFTPFLFIGIYYLFHKDICKQPLKFFITTFILLNITIVVLRYTCAGFTLSKRYILPLTAFTIFFVPIGLQVTAKLIDKLFRKKEMLEDKSPQWFYILLIIGITICIPKLFTPLRAEKKNYLSAIEWLKKNTPENSVIAVPDPRICFYAERKMLLVKGRLMSHDVNYTVKIHNNNFPPMISSDYPIKKIFNIEKGKELVIYKMSFQL